MSVDKAKNIYDVVQRLQFVSDELENSKYYDLMMEVCNCIDYLNNPWHTGTPTEGGMFLVYLKDGTYDIYEFGKEYKAFEIGFSDVVAWMPISPFKGEVNG